MQDDPNCQFTRYSIPDDKREEFEKMTQSVELVLKPKTTKQTLITNKNHGLW